MNETIIGIIIIIILGIGVGWFFTRDFSSLPQYPDSTKITTSSCKIVVAKETPIENRISGVEIFFGEGSISKSQTVYYLIFEDGSSREVLRKRFYQVKIGDCI